MNNCYVTISHITLLNFISVAWSWLYEMTNILGMTVLSRGIPRFRFRGLSRSQTNQRRANKWHAMDKTPTVPQGGCTLRLLPIFLFLLTVSFPFGRLLLSPPVLDVASSGRSLPPRWLVAHKGLVASPHMGHGTADVEIHDDADGDIGKWGGWSRSEDSCRTLPIYIWAIAFVISVITVEIDFLKTRFIISQCLSKHSRTPGWVSQLHGEWVLVSDDSPLVSSNHAYNRCPPKLSGPRNKFLRLFQDPRMSFLSRLVLEIHLPKDARILHPTGDFLCFLPFMVQFTKSPSLLCKHSKITRFLIPL